MLKHNHQEALSQKDQQYRATWFALQLASLEEEVLKNVEEAVRIKVRIQFLFWHNLCMWT